METKGEFIHPYPKDPDSAHAVEGLILGHLTRIASRDLGMFNPSTSQKLLQSKGASS